MADLTFIWFLLVCGTLLVHVCISNWKSKYRPFALALNLILPLVYLPIILNLWLKIKSASLSENLIAFAIAPLVLTGVHFLLWTMARRQRLPKKILALIWLSYLLPMLVLLQLICMKNQVFMPQNKSNLQLYISHMELYLKFLNVSIYAGNAMLALYFCFILYVGFLLETHLKIRDFWRKTVLRQVGPAKAGTPELLREGDFLARDNKDNR